MGDPRDADKYFARALELEACARRVDPSTRAQDEEAPSPKLAPRWRDSAFLRREAEWWRAYAHDLIELASK